MQINDIIDGLERELEIKQGLFSKKIDIDRCLELLEELKERTFSHVGEADRILQSRKEILKNADFAAKNTIIEAEKRAEHAAMSSELVVKAEREADRIIDSAYLQGEALLRKTREHIDSMFRDIEDFLLSNIAMIRKNRDELREISFSYVAK